MWDRLIDAFLIVLLLAMLVTNGTQLFGWRCLSVCQPLWSRQKYLDNYWIDNHGLCTDIHGAQRMNPTSWS